MASVKAINWISALGKWAAGQVVDEWPRIVIFLLGGGGMAYLAYITSWIKPYGPIAYGAAALLAVSILALSGLCISMMRLRFAQASYIAARASTKTANVLEPIHKHERINLIDFFNNLYLPTKDARFEKCELIGPANVSFDGCTMIDCKYSKCEIVLVNPGSYAIGASLFRNCHFLDSTLHGVTIWMTHKAWLHWPEHLRKNLPVVSDGTAGDVQAFRDPD